MSERKYRLAMWGDMYREIGIYKAIDRFIENGYHAMEYPDAFIEKYINLPREEYLAEAEKIKAYAKERDFEISQGHIMFQHPFLGKESLELLKKNIDFLYAVGVKYMVLHVTCYKKGLPLKKLKKKYYAEQVERLKELISYIGDRDIVLCLENIAQNANTERSDLILDYIHDCGNSPHLGICFDTGHLNRSNGLGHVKQSVKEFFEKSEGRIKALHVNGNAGDGDQHLFPYSGKEGIRIDWVSFVEELDKYGYGGLFNYEVPGERNYVPLTVRDMKMRYAKELYEYMISEDFLKNPDRNKWKKDK